MTDEIGSTTSRTRREALLAAALDLFAAHPYEDVSVDDVSAAAGVAHGLLSYHFGGKRGLFAATVRHAWHDLVAYEKPLATEVSAPERVRGFLWRHFEYARKHPARFRMLMRAGHADKHVMETLRAARFEGLTEVSAALGCPDRPSGLLRTAINGWVGYVDGVTVDWLEDESLQLHEVTNLCTQVLVAAVRSASELPLDGEQEAEFLGRVTGPPADASLRSPAE